MAAGLRLFSFFLFIVVWPASPAYCEPLIKAGVDKPRNGTGEVFVYSVNIEGEFGGKDIKAPEFGDLRVVSQSKVTQRVFKGKTGEMKIKMTYGLVAGNPGTYNIKGVVVKDKGKVFQGETITVEITGEPLREEPPNKLFDRSFTI